MQGKRFDITLQEKVGDDWSFESVVLARLHDHQRDADIGVADRRADGHLLGLHAIERCGTSKAMAVTPGSPA